MTIKELDERLEEGESLKAIAQAYSEIANLKVKKIRANVERNRVFFQEIAKVYAIIRKFAIQRKIAIVKPKQTVSIILTSNHGFNGPINNDLLRFFVLQTKNLETDRIIINKAGIDYFHSNPVFKDIKEILLKNDEPDSNELMGIVEMLKDYNRVLVFYPVMHTLLTQVPTVTDITASGEENLQSITAAHLEGGRQTKPGVHLPGEGNAGKESKESRDDEFFKFIFEPELPKILAFFDSQVNTLLLEETFLESELSRTASRFIAMDEAENASNRSIKEYQTLKAYAKRNADNNTILENFATMVALRKEA